MDADALRRRRLEREQFHALFDLAPDERVARLDALAQEDAALAAELRRVLARAEESPDDADATPGRRTGSIVSDRFRLLRLLGAGGMGEVYLAERTDDVDKKVALKLVRSDLPLPFERARRERQILARLEHPNIAGLIDAGLTDNGQPWFAMAYVDGESITVWCDRRALDLRARVRLFARAVEAVQFAHRNLVLHRDLKPSNILVDADGTPKLLDFGIAKLIDATDPRETQTLALTPAYAAPEQLRGEPATTASDVYQLGLVLYELLGGVPAREARDARTHSPPIAMLPRMDQVLSALILRNRVVAELIGRERRLGVDKLRRTLKGDLGRIVAKATADDPHERYATAQALADDLERWTNGLPVAAHRGSFGYRLRKALQRHAIAAVAVAALGIGMLATSVIAVRRAVAEREQREHAEQQQRRSDTLFGFMRDVIREGEPASMRGEKLTSRGFILRAAEKLEQRTDLDDVTKALLQVELADVWQQLEQPSAALPLAEAAVSTLASVRESHPVDYLHGCMTLAGLLLESGRYREIIDMIDDDLLDLARRIRDSNRAWYARLLTFRAIARMDTGQLRLAEDDLLLALDTFDRSGTRTAVDSTQTLSSLGLLYSRLGQPRRALEFFQREAVFYESGADSSSVNAAINRINIATVRVDMGEPAQALPMAEQALSQLERIVGGGYDRTILARYVLARSYTALGDAKSAQITLDAALAASSDLDSGNPQTSLLLRACRLRLSAVDGDRQALLDLEEMANSIADGAMLDRPQVVIAASLGEALLRNRDTARALIWLERAQRGAEEMYGKASIRIADIEDSIGRSFLISRDWKSAEEHLSRAIDSWRVLQGNNSPSTLRSEIHRLWLQFEQLRDPVMLERIQAKRSSLVRVLGSESVRQVRQVDALLERLGQSLGSASRPPAKAVRQDDPDFTGLSSFFL